MNCDEVRQHWELYHDSEGGSELYLQINEHLAACPPCAKWFFQQAQFEELVTAKLAAGSPSAELWRRVLGNAGVVSPVAARGWTYFNHFMAIAATLLIAVGIWYATSDRDDPHLSALTAVVHQQFAEELQPIEFISRSDEEVERYLKTRVPFVVRCPPREDAGFEVRGGGICTIAGEPAAYVVGRVEGQEVSIFILPQERLAGFAHERDVLSRETIHHCREGDFEMVLAKIDRNVVVVIGKGTPQQLEQIVRAYGTYPETPVDNAA
jgi:hypothetical protein